MGQNRHWTAQEIEYMQEKWGAVSMKSIARNLKRSVNAVKVKSHKIGLRNMLEAGDYITINALHNAIYGRNLEMWTYNKWINELNFPLKYKIVVTKKFAIVELNDFWKWAETNRSFLDFSKFEENMLGEEPQWAKQQRFNDCANKRKFKRTPWTNSEDEQLKHYLKTFKYSYDELSTMLNRTCGAIQRRIKDINLKERPVKADNHTPWTQEQTKALEHGIINGYSYELMAQKIGKSAKAIRGKAYGMYGTEKLDNARLTIFTNKKAQEELKKVE